MKLRYVLLALLAILQLAVPAWQIGCREFTLRHGEVFRFRTAPVDPYDALRGRYVSLWLEDSSAPVPPVTALDTQGRRFYARLGVDSEGYAFFDSLHRSPPTDGAYLKVRVQRFNVGQRAQLRTGFERYYLNDKLAPAAEAAFRRRDATERRESYLVVRVRDGVGVPEELFVGGLPIVEAAREQLDTGAAGEGGTSGP